MRKREKVRERTEWVNKGEKEGEKEREGVRVREREKSGEREVGSPGNARETKTNRTSMCWRVRCASIRGVW